MNVSSIVTSLDLIKAADELDHDLELMQVLGYPVIRNQGLSRLLRKVAVELEVLRLECWRLSQGESRS